jgi:ATP-dependent DNA helicase RecG
VRLSGTIDVRSGLASLTNPAIDFLDPKEPLANDQDRWEPVYSASAQFSSKQIARLIELVLDRAVHEIPDALPPELRDKRRLPPLATAILRYHKPTNVTDVSIARKRLAYDELLLSQLAVQLARRMRMERTSASPVSVDERLDQRIRKRIPFALTKGQERAVAEIRVDLARAAPMNRLLQGDVGCGKTAVAVYAALATIAKGHQVALLAPTEVLARQHAAKIAQYLRGSRVRTGFLSGASATAERAETLSALQKGEVSLLVGTHAVLEKGVQFADLGLAIIDEQQKFGVSQRFAMRAKAKSPHVLVLSATPIPRTLAMTLLGDLDISTIDGLPPGRKPVRTRLVGPDDSENAWKFVRSRLDRGEQAFVVYPLVDESENVDLRAATTEMEVLRSTHFAGIEVGLLHGKMKAALKEDVMARFRAGQIRLLVSTIVIEVGVDVPNATIIAIQHADRFGLSQLHQLRGRVGRGAKDSHCLLFADTKNETSIERLRVMCSTNDGFRIAEEDLRLRGPGELLGTRQHGAPAFNVADLIRDTELIQQAREDAMQLLKSDPSLREMQNSRLRAALVAQYGQSLRFIQVA